MGLNTMRGVTGWLRSVAPDRRTVKTDAVAGLPGAIGGVPDGMAASVLTGVNPIHGLYASFAGRVAGGLGASTELMVITTTSAAALAAGSAVESLSAQDRPAALFLLAILAGAVMITAGLLRLGRFTRFVSHSVMIGFLSGVAVNIIFGQIPDLTGAPRRGIDRGAEGLGRGDPPERDRSGLGPRRRVRLRHHCPARPHPGRRLQRGGRLGPADHRSRPGRRRRRPGRGPGRDPQRYSTTRLAPAVRVLVVAALRRAGGGRDRAGAGRRCRRVHAQRGRHTFEQQHGLHRPGIRQRRRGALPGPTRRRFGRADRAEPGRRGPYPVGVHLLRPVDAADPGAVLRSRRRGGHAHPGGAAHLRRRRRAAPRRNRHDLAHRARLTDRRRHHLHRNPAAPRRRRRRSRRRDLPAAPAQPGRPRPEAGRTRASQ